MGFPELGQVSLMELKAVRGPGGLTIERDLYFKADKTLSQYAAEAVCTGRCDEPWSNRPSVKRHNCTIGPACTISRAHAAASGTGQQPMPVYESEPAAPEGPSSSEKSKPSISRSDFPAMP